jgi:hypothetical protein
LKKVHSLKYAPKALNVSKLVEAKAFHPAQVKKAY